LFPKFCQKDLEEISKSQYYVLNAEATDLKEEEEEGKNQMFSNLKNFLTPQ